MMNTATSTSLRQTGFTLVEMVVTMVIAGIVIAMVSMFLRFPIQSYFDTQQRAELTNAADTALRRMARDLRAALPNSIRTRTGECLEFIPIISGGRYRSNLTAAGGGDMLTFTATDTSFNVLGTVSPAPANGDRVVIYNLGIDGADAYRGQNIATITGASTASNIVLAAATQFPFSSPSNRFHIVPAAEPSVFYTCSGGNLYRYTGYTIDPAPPAGTACPTPPAGTPILTGNVATNGCTFAYSPGVTQRNGLATLRLRLTKNDESVNLYHEVHVNNAP